MDLASGNRLTILELESGLWLTTKMLKDKSALCLSGANVDSVAKG
jgi:hypothetical protein